MEKTIVVVQARMGSTRLPGKSLMPVWKNVSLLEMVLLRIKRAEVPDHVILATSTDKEDDLLVSVGRKCKVDVVRGSKNDVLERFVKALERFPAEAVVRACADNPLLDPQMIDNLIKFFWEKYPECDYVMNLGPKTGFPDGVGVEMVSADTLRQLDNEAKGLNDREHVLTFLHNNLDYRSCYLHAEEKYQRPKYRLDIDYQEDLEFIRELLKRMPEQKAPYWTTLDIINAIDNKPELLKMRKVRE